ncbi:hypothetical protein ACFXAE_01325 [Streptomyces sp. NPDC059454]
MNSPPPGALPGGALPGAGLGGVLGATGPHRTRHRTRPAKA